MLYKIRQYNCTKIYMTPSERRVSWATIYSKNHGSNKDNYLRLYKNSNFDILKLNSTFFLCGANTWLAVRCVSLVRYCCLLTILITLSASKFKEKIRNSKKIPTANSKKQLRSKCIGKLAKSKRSTIFCAKFSYVHMSKGNQR